MRQLFSFLYPIPKPLQDTWANHNERELTMLQAAVFDMDGLLVDSEPFWQQAQVDVFSSLGVSICIADTHQTMGQRIDQVVEFWYSKQPWQQHSIAAVTGMIVARVEELIRERKPCAMANLTQRSISMLLTR